MYVCVCVWLTIIAHDVLHRCHVLYISLVPSEYLGSWAQLIGGVRTHFLCHLRIARHVVNFLEERNVVRRPVAITENVSLVATGNIPGWSRQM